MWLTIITSIRRKSIVAAIWRDRRMVNKNNNKYMYVVTLVMYTIGWS